jgi:hypothetical protein
VTYPHVGLGLGRIESDTDFPLVAYTTTLSLIRSGGRKERHNIRRLVDIRWNRRGLVSQLDWVGLGSVVTCRVVLSAQVSYVVITRHKVW